MDVEWENGFTIKVSVDNGGGVVIAANRQGLLSLAGQLTALADAEVGSHIHYDEHNSLEDRPAPMIIEKIS